MERFADFPWRRVALRSAKIALIVGAVLNLINQPEAIFGDAPIDWPKALLTFCVPFLVSAYGSACVLLEKQAETNIER